MPVQDLDKNNFNTTIQSSKNPVIVDFYADWCGPCKMIAPVMEQIANTHTDIDVYRVDVDKDPELAAQFGIMNIPTIISFKDGAPYKKVVGAQGIANMLKLVE